MRAGISGVMESPLCDPVSGDLLRAGRPHTPQWWARPDMLAELAAAATCECLAQLPSDIDVGEVPILVLVSDTTRPHREADLGPAVFTGLRARLHHPLAAGSKVYEDNRFGIFNAYIDAAAMIAARRASHVIIVGTDSYLRQQVASAYVERRRVLTQDNSNGFNLGEAACAVLLSAATRRAGELHIIGHASGRESGTIESEEPLTGHGLTQALRGALNMAGIRMDHTDYWLTDQTGEHYKAKECTLAQIRLERRTDPTRKPYTIWHPIEYLGEIGCAIGPCLWGMALIACRKGYAPGKLAQMHVSDESGARAAFVLSFTGELSNQ